MLNQVAWGLLLYGVIIGVGVDMVSKVVRIFRSLRIKQSGSGIVSTVLVYRTMKLEKSFLMMPLRHSPLY